MTTSVINQSFLDLLRKDGVIQSDHPLFRPLTGGISSEIYQVKDGSRTMVVKRALKKLRVKSEWFADPSRNRYEAAFFRYVASFIPHNVPKILFRGEGYFVMEYMDGFQVWKSLLLEKKQHLEDAKQAGTILGQIHRHSFGDSAAFSGFDSISNFIQLRIAPYLYPISEIHPGVTDIVLEEADRLINTRECLIHGDYSPKNILVSSERMVIVDAEVAVYGDPAFDISFMLCHLFLKALFHAPQPEKLKVLPEAFWYAYLSQGKIGNLDSGHLERRTCRLLLLLLLARVDGKSPVEYLNPEKQAFTRNFALKQIKDRNFNLKFLLNQWYLAMEKNNLT